MPSQYLNKYNSVLILSGKPIILMSAEKPVLYENIQENL